jgi:CelD/BcsL family acetyltransferase involved in cellulose biosynthesis
LFTWWRHFGADKRLLLIAAFENGMLAGLAPLYADACAEGFRDLHFIGQGLSDYADFITPRDRPDIAEALVSALLDRRSSWDGMDLEEIPAQSPNKVLLGRLIGADSVPGAWQTTVQCPYLPIKTSWEEFYGTMGKGFRHEVRNKLNRWNSRGSGRIEGLELRYVDRREVDGAFVDEVVALSDRRRSSDGHRSPFLNHPDQEFLRDVLPLMGRRNQLRVGELRSGDTLLAFMLAFHWEGTAYTWNTQYEPAFSAFSLGRIVLVRLAEQRFRDGCHELDFMRGEEPYKFQWTSLSRTNLALRTERTAQSAGEEAALRGCREARVVQGERST